MMRTTSDDGEMARWYAGARVVIGATLLVMPRLLTGWIGDDARRPGTRAIARCFAARDLAIGAGTLLAMADGAPLRRWLQVGAASDAADAVASLLALGRIPTRKALTAMAAAVGGAAAGAHLAQRVP
ncbi:MAG: hypothetical protein M3P85_16510 [Actinomycetota bacterium]|nr:hypothetical protein [Actinomycetota bacterium]